MKCPECGSGNLERTGLQDPEGFELECIDCGYKFFMDEWPEEDVVDGYSSLS